MQIAKRKLILQAVGDDAPSQMAQLLALEYLTGVTDTDRLIQVGLLTELCPCSDMCLHFCPECCHVAGLQSAPPVLLLLLRTCLSALSCCDIIGCFVND